MKLQILIMVLIVSGSIVNANAINSLVGVQVENKETKMAVGEEQDGNLILEWSGTDPLVISSIDTNTEDSGLSISFNTPLILSPDPSGMTTSKIPYTIESAKDECVDLQTPDCVFVDSTYKIPLEINASDKFGQIRGATILEVDIVSGYEVAQLTALGLGGLALAGIIVRKTVKKRK